MLINTEYEECQQINATLLFPRLIVTVIIVQYVGYNDDDDDDSSLIY
jgi:hypothetical protein